MEYRLQFHRQDQDRHSFSPSESGASGSGSDGKTSVASSG